MVKQLIVVALVLALGFGFVACKQDNGTPPTPGDTEGMNSDMPEAPEAPADLPDAPAEPEVEPPARPNLPN